MKFFLSFLSFVFMAALSFIGIFWLLESLNFFSSFVINDMGFNISFVYLIHFFFAVVSLGLFFNEENFFGYESGDIFINISITNRVLEGLGFTCLNGFLGRMWAIIFFLLVCAPLGIFLFFESIITIVCYYIMAKKYHVS